ncbi:MAG: RecX family transcriptional regulator [Cyclobacteriaceae bacterium]
MSRAAYLKQAKTKAAKFCSSRERAPFEVIQKLQKWELNDEEAQSVLAELVEERFVDEQRFCRAFCNDKFEFNRWGKVKIQQALFQYHLPEEVIKEGLAVIDPEKYEAVLLELASKKWHKVVGSAWDRKQKTLAYMLSKGFEMDLTFEALKKLEAMDASSQK